MTGTESILREQICRVGASLFGRGYVHGTAGNISARLPDGYLITPTDACLGFLEADSLAKVTSDGRQISGKPASKTLRLHASIYGADDAAACIIHTHSRNLVALSLRGVWSSDDSVPPLTPYYVMKVGHVPLIRYHRPGDPAVAEFVIQKIESMRHRKAPIHAVLIERLGPIVWNDTPTAALATLEELEETAFLWNACQDAAPLTIEQIEELKIAFNASW